jgi:hypothetical protein
VWLPLVSLVLLREIVLRWLLSVAFLVQVRSQVLLLGLYYLPVAHIVFLYWWYRGVKHTAFVWAYIVFLCWWSRWVKRWW